MSDLPRLSVVIPTRGRPEHAAACVRAILAQESPPPFEVVVADQSDDVTSAAAGSDPRVRVERVSGRGRSRALNAGIRVARAPWIVVTDDDCRPGPDWLASLGRAIDGVGDRTVVLGRIVAGPKGPGAADPPAVLDRASAFDVSACGFEDWIYPNLAFPRAAIDAVGGYDERLGVGTRIPGGEDNDWGYRLLRAGWTIAYRPEPVVVHEAWRSIEERSALKRAYGIGQGGFYAKHLAKLDAFMILRLVYDLARQAKGFTLAALTARDRDARGHLAYAGGLVYGVFSMGELIVRGVPERGEA